MDLHDFLYNFLFFSLDLLIFTSGLRISLYVIDLLLETFLPSLFSKKED